MIGPLDWEGRDSVQGDCSRGEICGDKTTLTSLESQRSVRIPLVMYYQPGIGLSQHLLWHLRGTSCYSQ